MKNIGKYQILGKIGAGNMGTVFKAMDPRMKRIVAIKTMSTKIDSDPDLRNRFFREAEAAAHLSHKNIITVYDMDEDDGRAYLAMEFLEGQDLKQQIAARAPMPLERRLEIMIDICTGLSHAHRKGVVHRDIKPSNIFMTNTGDVKILDFGLARITSSDLTGTGAQMGTPAYMSPEQIQSAKVDQRSDIYSAGVVFYELLSYAKAFQGDSLPAILFKVIQLEPDPLKHLDHRIPEELSDIVQRAMAKDPDQRYRQIDDLMEELTEFRDSLPERTRILSEEAKQALNRLESLIRENKQLLPQANEKLEEIALEAPTLMLGLGTGRLGESTKRTRFTLHYFDLVEFCDRAKRDYERFSTLVEKRKASVSMLTEAATLDQWGDFEKALQTVETVLRDDPSFAEANSLCRRIHVHLEEKKLLQERTARAEKNFEKAEAFYASGDLSACLTCLNETLSLQPEHNGAASRLGIVQAEIRIQREQEARRRQAEEALISAHAALLSGDLTTARSLLARALAEYPDAPGSAELDTAIERAEKEERIRQERKREILDLFGEAKAHLDVQNEDHALKLLAQIRELDATYAPALELRKSLEEKRAARENERRERQARLADKISQAENAEREGNLEQAGRLAQSILAEVVGHRGGRDLLARVEAAYEQRRQMEEEKERKIQQLLETVSLARAAGKSEEALNALESAASLQANHPRIQELRRQITEDVRAERERIRTKIAVLVAKGQQALESADLNKAGESVSEILALEPGNTEANNLLKRIRKAEQEKQRREEIAELLSRALRSTGLGEFDRASIDLDALQILDPENRDAALLRRQVEKGRRAQEKLRAKAKKTKAAANAPHKEQSSTLDAETIVIRPKTLRGFKGLPRTAMYAAGGVFLLMLAIAAYVNYPRPKAITSEARLSQARSFLQQGQYDKVLEIAQEFPGNSEARSLGEQALKMQGINKIMASARSLREQADREQGQLKFDRLFECKAEAQRIVDQMPDHEPARLLITEVQRELDGLEAAQSREQQEQQLVNWMAKAEQLVQADRYTEAKGEIIKILQRRPHQPRALELDHQVNQKLAKARAESDAAEKLAQQARSVSEKAGAVSLAQATYQAARGMEIQGLELKQSQRYPEAAQMLSRAEEAYRGAEKAALDNARQAGRERQLIEAKAGADAIRRSVDQVRGSAEKAGADSLAQKTYQEAKSLEAEASRLYSSQQFHDAGARYQQALDTFGKAEKEALENAQASIASQQLAKTRTAAEEAQKLAQAARNSAEKAGALSLAPKISQEARSLEAEAANLYSSQRFSDAAEKYLQVAEIYRRSEKEARDKGHQQAEEDQLRGLVQAYLSALTHKDLDQAKSAWWPAMSKFWENHYNTNFPILKSYEVEYQFPEPQINGDSAIIDTPATITMTDLRGQRSKPSTVYLRFEVSKRGGQWFIADIKSRRR